MAARSRLAWQFELDSEKGSPQRLLKQNQRLFGSWKKQQNGVSLGPQRIAIAKRRGEKAYSLDTLCASFVVDLSFSRLLSFDPHAERCLFVPGVHNTQSRPLAASSTRADIIIVVALPSRAAVCLRLPSMT